MFFIADPEVRIEGLSEIDELVEEVKGAESNVLAELFSTHPHPAKKLKNLDKFV